ncbi:uncharacterized protein N7473_000199 [Penicillium subrubescens]|uniref:uncharacterized protein n=1 Tax=Penicillium subrubescens TaxID=1316194 RepID=UPI00254546CE|nr:uncharacterized protein N7473_000199 [Penicillium subrubescens]KAJ5910896.1 hypothetical protein N7473_000199 [Penicillium subrubescens]
MSLSSMSMMTIETPLGSNSTLHIGLDSVTMAWVRCNGCAEMRECQVYSGIPQGDTRVTKMFCDPCATAKGHK